MDDLFTFNSKQFKFISIPSSLHSLRKKNTRLPPKKISSIQTDSTDAEPPKYSNKSRDGRRNVQFSALPSDQHAKVLLSSQENLEEDVRKREGFSSSKSRRYLAQLYNKRSLELESPGCLDERVQPNSNISSAEVELCPKKQRRQKSFRLAPKVLLPLSDRKLPKVFKMIGGENFLPPLPQKQSMKKLGLNKSIRDTFSSQRARRLLNYGDQLSRMSKCGFMEDEKQSTIES